MKSIPLKPILFTIPSCGINFFDSFFWFSYGKREEESKNKSIYWNGNEPKFQIEFLEVHFSKFFLRMSIFSNTNFPKFFFLNYFSWMSIFPNTNFSKIVFLKSNFLNATSPKPVSRMAKKRKTNFLKFKSQKVWNCWKIYSLDTFNMVVGWCGG